MSIDYAKVQKDICDIRKGELEAEEEEFCPTCLINPHASPPLEWWNEIEPYLNQKTCEYYIPININAEGRTYTTNELQGIQLPFNIFKYSYIRTAIRKALRQFNKMEDDGIVCALLPNVIFPSTGGFQIPKPHLYDDEDLRPYLGRFYIETTHKDKNGNEFKIQEINENLVEQFPQITNYEALELFAQVKDYHLGNGFETIKMLVTIPASVFDPIPLTPLAVTRADDEEEEEVDEEENLKDSVELDAFKFQKNIATLSNTFGVWQQYQAMFFNLQGGRVMFRSLFNPEKDIKFYIRNYSVPIRYFKDHLEKLLLNNDFILTDNEKTTDQLAPEKIKITFKKPTETKPYRIEKIEAKYKNCEYKELSNNFDNFLMRPQTADPTLLNYVANMEESALAIQLQKSAPWLDWVETYTYPRTTIIFGEALNVAGLSTCIEPPSEDDGQDDTLFNIDFDLGDALGWFASQMNCKTLKQMERYDPVEELNKLGLKFGKLIDKKLWSDNNAIRELFGIPLDTAAIVKSGDPLKKISEFFNRVSLCNLSSLLFEILKCLFGTFSLDEMLEVIVTRILMIAGVPAFKLIYQKSPLSVQEETRDKAVDSLGGFDKTPWEYYEEKLSKGGDVPKYMVWLAGVDEKAEGRGTRQGLGGGENPPEKNLEEVFSAWLKEFMATLGDLEWILEQIKDFPGSEILKMAIAIFACPQQSVLKQWFGELKGILNFGALSPCSPAGEKFFNLPNFAPLATMAWKDILRAFLMILIKKLIDIIASILLGFLMKFLAMLNCDSFKNMLDFLANGNNKALEEAIGESFCDQAGLDNQAALDTALALMDAQGLGSNPDELLPMAADISALAGVNEFKKAFLNSPEEQDPDFCLMMSSMVNDRHPKFAPLLGSPANIANFFSGIGNFLSPRQKEVVAASIVEADDDFPIEPEICLTNEELERWNEEKKAYIDRLCGNMPMHGTEPGEPEEPTLGDDWLDKLNKRKRSSLEDTMDLFIMGPAAGIGEALEEALKLEAPSCHIDPETGEAVEPDELGASNSAMPPMPEEVTSMIDEATKGIYGTLDTSYIRDMVGGFHSYFNWVLADTYNFPYVVGRGWTPSHRGAVDSTWFWPNAAHNESGWQSKWDAAKERNTGLVTWRMRRHAPQEVEDPNDATAMIDTDFDSDSVYAGTNVYPQTVGLWMHGQMTASAESLKFTTDISLDRERRTYNTSSYYEGRRSIRKYKRMDGKWVSHNIVITPIPKEQASLSFRDNNHGMGGWDTGFDLKCGFSHDESGNQTRDLSYRLIMDRLESTNIGSGLDWKIRASGSDFTDEVAALTILQNRYRDLNAEIPIDMNRATEIFSLYSEASNTELKSYSYPGIVFKNYINGLYNSVDVSLDVGDSALAGSMFDNLNTFAQSQIIAKSLNDPNDADGLPECFKFGYVDDVVTKADVTYVDDEPGAESYNYEKEEKKMGKSMTDHPRVKFLNPDEYGMGKFHKAKYYVEEPKQIGWLGILSLLVPEEDNHEPKRKNFLFVDELIKSEKDLREQIPFDERLNDERKCLQERTYDILNVPTGHSGLHTAVLMTTRVYVLEHILKALSIYSILKIDFQKNYDHSVLGAIAQDMEDDLKDVHGDPKRSPYKGLNYWLLFLEQSVQTFERLLITGELEVDDVIADLLEELKQIREKSPVFTEADKRWMKFISEVTYDDSGHISNIKYEYRKKKVRKKKIKVGFESERLGLKKYPLPPEMAPVGEQEERIKSHLDAIMFYTFGKGFRAILAGETREFAFRMRRRQRYAIKMAIKIYNIWNTKDFAMTCLRYVIADQLEYYADKLRTIADDEEAAYPYKPRPYIDDLRKFFLGSSGILVTPLDAGTSEKMLEHKEKLEEDPDAVYDYGNDAVKHVLHTPLQNNPVTHFTGTEKAKLLDESPEGNFYFEKYLRVIDKEHLTGAALTRREKKIQNRDDLLKNVVNIKEFQAWLNDNFSILTNPHANHRDYPHEDETEPHEIKISDLFGNAVPIYGEPSSEDESAAAGTGEEPPPPLVGYEGSTGIKFGVRLCYIPKSDYDPTVPSSVALNEKSFLFASHTYTNEEDEVVEEFPEHNVRKIFPLVSYERDILDGSIIELNLLDDNFGENLNCYIEELLQSPEMDLIFDYCIPLRRAPGLMATYANYAFIPSIGQDPTERSSENAEDAAEKWKTRVFSKTKRNLRSIFKASYESARWTIFAQEDDNPRDRDKRGFKLNWSINKLNWGFRFYGFGLGRRQVSRPWDMYGNMEDDDAS